MKHKPMFSATARRRSLLYWHQLNEEPMKKQTQSTDRQAFLDKIAAVRAQARDLEQQIAQFHQDRRVVRVFLAEVQEEIDKALLQGRRATSKAVFEAANATIVELEPKLKQHEKIESNCMAEIARLEQMINETDEKIQSIINEEKMRLFEKFKAELPMEMIYRMYALYRKLPLGGFKWDFFVNDAGLTEPIGDNINPFDSEWCEYFDLETAQ